MLRILLAPAFASSSHALTALAPLRAARLPAISSLPRMSAEEEEVPSALQGRPRFAPGRVVEAPVVEEEEAAAAAVDMAELEGLVTPINDLGEPDMLTDEKKKSGVVMDKLKGEEDNDGGISQLLGTFLLKLDPTGTVRRRLWTRADFMHIHAVSGAYFLFLGIPWLVYSHAVAALDPSTPMETSSWFLTSLLLAGLVNALSAIPMSRFSSNKLFDLKDLKANGFTFGGTGLTCMCLWIAWWFSGDYPQWLHAFDIPVYAMWALVCAGTTVNWEYMLQQNFEANERAGRKFAKVPKKEMMQKAILYRLASWPNLTQLTFMFSIPFGGLAWVQSVTAAYPMQMTPMYHYGIASAMGYALSMFSETLRDRKLVSLETDLLILIIGFCFPMVSVAIDAATYGDAVTIWPPEYWALFGAFTQ